MDLISCNQEGKNLREAWNNPENTILHYGIASMDFTLQLALSLYEIVILLREI